MNAKYIDVDLIIAFTTLSLSMISILAGAALRILYQKRIALECLGWGILLTSLWNISSSGFREVLFPNAQYSELIIFFITLFLPVPFFFYVNQLQEGRYGKIYRILEWGVLAELAAYLLLHLAGVRNLVSNARLMLLLFSLSLIVSMATIIYDMFQGHIRKYLLSAMGLAVVSLVVFVKVIPFFLYGRRIRSDSLLPFGLIFLLILAAVSTVQELIQMEQGKQQAIMASEAKGRFLANMSHEIRTPINTVLGMDEMILRECTEPQIKEYAMDIQNAGQSLLSLINDILDLSKIESGKLEILPVEYDFSSLIHDIMNMIDMKANAKGLEVHLSVPRNLPSRLWGDDVRIRQILINLMNNAVKYTEKGSVTLSVTGNDRSDAMASSPECEGHEETISLTFRVQDTGIGIKKEDISKLFAEYERIEEKRNRNIEGTGLGMSITTQLLELMGSNLEIDSVYGKGSTFSFTLEQKIIDKEPIGNLEERIRKQARDYSYSELFTAPDAQILVVDDNAMNRRVFSNLLKSTQVAIDEAGGGQECLDLAEKKRYDIIFLDHMMPDMDGIETLHRLRKQKNSPCLATPVVALTANAVTGAREMYLEEGFSSFLSKPINPRKLEKFLLQTLPEDKIHKGAASSSDAAQTGSSDTVPPASEKDLPSAGEGELPEIDGIDWEYALMHTKDPEMLRATVLDFYRLMPGDGKELEKFWKMVQNPENEREEAFRQFRVKVHSMKSSAAMVGAVPLSGVARMLEYAARDGNYDTIEKVTPPFLEEWRKMRELLSPLAENEAKGQKGEADFQIVSQCLPRLNTAMGVLDVDTADQIMAQLEEYQYPQPLADAMEQLSLAVTNLDAAKAAEQIELINQYISNNTQ